MEETKSMAEFMQNSRSFIVAGRTRVLIDPLEIHRWFIALFLTATHAKEGPLTLLFDERDTYITTCLDPLKGEIDVRGPLSNNFVDFTMLIVIPENEGIRDFLKYQNQNPHLEGMQNEATYLILSPEKVFRGHHAPILLIDGVR